MTGAHGLVRHEVNPDELFSWLSEAEIMEGVVPYDARLFHPDARWKIERLRDEMVNYFAMNGTQADLAAARRRVDREIRRFEGKLYLLEFEWEGDDARLRDQKAWCRSHLPRGSWAWRGLRRPDYDNWPHECFYFRDPKDLLLFKLAVG